MEFKQNLNYFLFLIGKQHELRILIKHFILHFTVLYWKHQFKMACSVERSELKFGLKDHKLEIMVYPQYVNLLFVLLYLLNLFTVPKGTSDESTTASEKHLVRALRKTWIQFMD